MGIIVWWVRTLERITTGLRRITIRATRETGTLADVSEASDKGGNPGRTHCPCLLLSIIRPPGCETIMSLQGGWRPLGLLSIRPGCETIMSLQGGWRPLGLFESFLNLAPSGWAETASGISGITPPRPFSRLPLLESTRMV